MSRPLIESVPSIATEIPDSYVMTDRVTGLTLQCQDPQGGDLYLDQLLGWLAKERPDWYLRLVGRRQISEAEAALASGALKASVSGKSKMVSAEDFPVDGDGDGWG